ncbi:MAG TPA: type II toxin-antitoxin system prevent-host-death family antitoxin [Mesorhizobium sp.]|jgi:antitoxin YefM|nr:type II toxin-antitoxin system prevent-host-death family antitoxin [Mesorhizobium sp.]
MTRHVSMTEFRANMAKYFDEVEADHAELVVTRQGRESLVVMTLSDFESLTETTFLLSSPANARMLRESIAELDAGNGIERELIEPDHLVK